MVATRSGMVAIAVGGKVGDCRVASLLTMTVGVGGIGGKVAMVALVAQASENKRMVAISGRRDFMLVAPR